MTLDKKELLDDTTKMIDDTISELQSMGQQLVDTSLHFTHPRFSDYHPEWSLVCQIGERLVELGDELNGVAE